MTDVWFAEVRLSTGFAGTHPPLDIWRMVRRRLSEKVPNGLQPRVFRILPLWSSDPLGPHGDAWIIRVLAGPDAVRVGLKVQQTRKLDDLLW